MARQLRVLYLSLPVLDYHYDYWGADHPLAGGFLAAYALSRGARHEPTFLKPSFTSTASDPALIQKIVSCKPDVLACTMSLWNVERTMAIAAAVQRTNPNIIALAGGPEATQDFGRRFPKHPFAWVCAGEGEVPWSAALRLLSDKRHASAWEMEKAAQREKQPLQLSDLPSPYLSELLPLAPDGSAWVETMRGCPFRCSYCYYGKSHQGLRHYPQRWLSDHLAWARKHRAAEIYLLDPSFQMTPGLEQRLDLLARQNRPNIPLHTEARVESITERMAAAFAKAGFCSVETGLQSIHPKVLRSIRRPANPQAFARGARYLLNHGIELQVDIMLGLPGDTPEGFLQTVDFLLEHDLGEQISVYPLLLLPGTELRSKAASLGIRFQAKPPYQIECSPTWNIPAMREVLYATEKRLDQSLFPLHLPDFTPKGNQGEMIGVVEVDLARTTEVGLAAPDLARLTQCPVFLFHLPQHPPWEMIKRWVTWQHRKLPRLMVFWGFQTERPVELDEVRHLMALMHQEASYQARLWLLSPEPYLRLSCRPFLLSRCANHRSDWSKANELLPVIRRTPDPLDQASARGLGHLPVLWENSRPLDPKNLRALKKIFLDREEELLFDNRQNRSRWIKHNQLPDAIPGETVGRLRL